MDEIFGYLPPVANPPSKAPLLTLLKQARAFGVGIVLATQNPVDLDYKALSNAGTWFIGRLQTARDQQRVLDGLAGASGEARFDRKRMGQLLAGLGNRVFLMNNVHEDQPVLFESRWVMSYLRGPLTRDQIRLLMQPLRAELAAAAPTAAAASANAASRADAVSPAGQSAAPGKAPAFEQGAMERPVVTPALTQFFLPQRGAPEGAGTLVYEPRCLGIAKVYYADAKAGLAAEREVAVLAEIDSQLSRPLWEEAAPAQVRDRDLETVPEPGALFAAVPAALGDPKSYAAWGADFREWLYRSQGLRVFRSPSLDLSSIPGE
jgi:hypothetical protein